MDKKTNFNAWYIIAAVLGRWCIEALWQQAQDDRAPAVQPVKENLEQGKLDDLLITEPESPGR